MAKIELRNLAHTYGGAAGSGSPLALRGVNHVWEEGGAYALLGPSGCGKTTLLNAISGILTPTEGQVIFDGRDVTALSPRDRNIAQVFQFPVIYDTMTVEENIAFPLRNRGVRGPDLQRRVAQTLELIGLSADARRQARGLRADEKQKISLARGLVRDDVAAILFDEPLTVIDPAKKWELRAALKALHRRAPRTMIYVTHDQTEALTFADQVVVMYEGEIVQIGAPEQLFERPQHTFVGYFIGSPGMNVLPATRDGQGVRAGGVFFPLRAPQGGERLEIGVRPEHVRVSAEGHPAQLLSMEDAGRYRILRLRMDNAPVVAMIRDSGEPPGDVRVSFPAGRVHLYADGRLVDTLEGRRET
jgi:glycerol transport system ATP-binding protein